MTMTMTMIMTTTLTTTSRRRRRRGEEVRDEADERMMKNLHERFATAAAWLCAWHKAWNGAGLARVVRPRICKLKLRNMPFVSVVNLVHEFGIPDIQIFLTRCGRGPRVTVRAPITTVVLVLGQQHIAIPMSSIQLKPTVDGKAAPIDIFNNIARLS